MTDADVETLLRAMRGWDPRRRERAIAGLVSFQMMPVERGNVRALWIDATKEIQDYFRPRMPEDGPDPREAQRRA